MKKRPTAPPAMPAARKDAIANLKSLHDAALRAGVRFCLMDGTLLGAWRDGDFCKGDEDDIDVGVLDSEYDAAVPALCRAMGGLGFRVADEFVHGGRIEGVKLERGASHIDVVRVNRHANGAECYNLGRTASAKLAFVYPAHHHEGSDVVVLHGMEFATPADPEGFLTARYGDWRTPIPRERFNWQEDSAPGSIHPLEYLEQ